MGKMIYDPIRTEEIDAFIKRIYQIGLTYGDDFISNEKRAEGIIYNQMCNIA